MPETKTIQDLLYEQFAQGKRPSHPDVKAIKINHAKIKSNTRYRYFEAFKKSIGPEEYAKLFPEDELSKEQLLQPPLDNSVEVVGEAAGGAPKETAGKPEAKEDKAVQALKKAQAEGNKAEHEGNKAETKTKKAETKAPPSSQAIKIPSEAIMGTRVPNEFTIVLSWPAYIKLWSAMQATIERWGWSPDTTLSEWLVYFLDRSMDQRGIELGPYHVKEGYTFGDNGQHEPPQEPEIDWEMEAQGYDRVNEDALVRATSAIVE
jgi:hypothetical protein